MRSPFGIARQRYTRTQQGAVAIMVAISMTGLVVVGGMVLDFGLIRIDRQENKLAADDAVMAGLRAADKGSTEIYSEEGVCGALAFLRVNRPDFATLPMTSAVGSLNCATPSPTAACNAATPATYQGSVSLPGRSYTVTIKSPFQVNDGTFPEDSYASVASDDSAMSGCDQIGVIIEQERKPGLGSLATEDDLETTIRSVGRVSIGPGDDAPAMLLLKRTGCPILQTGSAAGGSYIHVRGAASADNSRSQAGTIHADSDGSGCSNSILFGKGSDGIVAYAAPQLANHSLPDPSKPGILSTVAGANGAPISKVRDSAANVYASAALDESGAASAAKTEPMGRALVTRRLVDARYLGGPLGGVTAAISGANGIFSTITSPTSAATAGYTLVSDCNATGTITAAPSSPGIYVDCTHNNGFRGPVTLDAQTVIFNGKVNPQSTAGTAVSLPSAKKVYVFGSSANAITIGNNSALTMNTAGNLDGGNCQTTIPTSSKAVLFVKDGQFKQTGGLLRLCNTTVMMMGGQSNGCLPPLSYLTSVPPVTASAPTQSPCSTGMGTGQYTQTGGGIDWTAPNQYDVMTLPDGSPDPTKTPSWSDPNGPEDLALWSESAGNNSSTTYSMAGGGLFAVRGVFMTPNADPFTLAGGALLDLTNAQFIATSISLDGNTTRVLMAVDPDSAVTLPQLTPFTLVR
jgi:hypothetical protein